MFKLHIGPLNVTYSLFRGHVPIPVMVANYGDTQTRPWKHPIGPSHGKTERIPYA